MRDLSLIPWRERGIQKVKNTSSRPRTKMGTVSPSKPIPDMRELIVVGPSREIEITSRFLGDQREIDNVEG